MRVKKMQFTQLKRRCLYSDNIYYKKNANDFHFIELSNEAAFGKGLIIAKCLLKTKIYRK